jgi:hypothetical protein
VILDQWEAAMEKKEHNFRISVKSAKGRYFSFPFMVYLMMTLEDETM